MSRPSPSTGLSRRLLAFRWRALSRRLRQPAALALALAILVIGALGLTLLGRTLAAAGSDETVVRDQVFWLGTLAALVYCYTSFEVIFRAPDARFLAALPLSGAHRFDDLLVRALLLHLPLVLPSVAYALALYLLPAPGAARAGSYALAVGLVQFVVGMSLSVWLHLLAGRSLLSKSSELRRMLAGAAVPDESALLVYAPALGLFATLAIGIFIDLALREAVLRDKGAWLLPVVLAGAGVAALALMRARDVARHSLHLILPRFYEVDVPPPYREDGVKKRVAGERLARLLPAPAKPYFMRDLRQLRRRHRLDRVLLWVFAAACLKLALDARAPALPVLSALALMNGVFIIAAFRLRGELASSWLDKTLPKEPRAELVGRLAASAHHPTWAALVAALMTLASGDVAAAALVLALGLPLSLALVAAAHAVADVGRERPGLAATLWRIAIASAVITLGGLA